MNSREIRLYELLEKSRFETTYPPCLKGLAGRVDFHAHVGIARSDPVALAKHATRAGMKAILFKMAPTPSGEIARLTNEVVADWAAKEGLNPVSCFGGVVLNTFLGGLNLELVRRSVASGGRAVWMPTITSAHHLMRAKGMSLEQARLQGLYILDGGRLLPEAKDIVKFVADNNIILSFGHLSREEVLALAEEADRLNFKKVVADHPFASVVGIERQDFLPLARSGVYFNFTYFEISPFVGVSPIDMAEAMQEIGPGRAILSSDVGPDIFPDPVESMRLLITMMRACGLEEEALDKISQANASRLLDLEDG